MKLAQWHTPENKRNLDITTKANFLKAKTKKAAEATATKTGTIHTSDAIPVRGGLAFTSFPYWRAIQARISASERPSDTRSSTWARIAAATGAFDSRTFWPSHTGHSVVAFIS